MPLGSTIKATDPFTGEQKDLNSFKQVSIEAYKLIKRCVKENEARGKQGDERFIVCAIHIKSRPNHRHSWFNLTCHEPDMDPKIPGEPGALVCSAPRRAYAGYMGHAETLMDGEWRIATAEQEKACRKIDEDATAAKLAERQQNAADRAAQTMNTMVRAVMGPQPVPAPAPAVPVTPVATPAPVSPMTPQSNDTSGGEEGDGEGTDKPKSRKK